MTPARPLAAALVAALLLAACTSTTVRPLPSVAGWASLGPASAPAASSATPPSSVQASPPGPSPAPSSAPPRAFTTPVPPAADAPWTSIHWQRLAPDTPLSLVRSALRWRGGFLSLGADRAGTPVWTSRDGAHWEPLPVGPASSFWPGRLVVGLAEVPSGLLALTLPAGSHDGGTAPAGPTASPTLPLLAWTSPDGRTWTPGGSPDLGSPAPWHGPPLLAAGPAGLVVAAPTAPPRLATSTDGIHWRRVPAGALPARFQISAMRGTARGVTAVGSLAVDPDHARAVAFGSADGTTWRGPYALLDPPASVMLASSGASWGASALVAARAGLIATGEFFAAPGAALWWQSADGRTWHSLPGYPPLGPTTCIGEGCGGGPDGSLLGDGQRMVALRGGADGGVWTSLDGLLWQRLAVSGEVPDAAATAAGTGHPPALLPGGLLVSDGSTTWFGAAGTG
jgi:hypothetical protein